VCLRGGRVEVADIAEAVGAMKCVDAKRTRHRDVLRGLATGRVI
jgi:hypothetical protein